MPIRFQTRSFALRLATINEAERSVEGVIATGDRVQVWDWDTWEIIDEVLVLSGASYASEFRLLKDHNSRSIDGVLGSARQPRRENAGIVARVYFAVDDPEADRAWNKTRQAHLPDLSIGYYIDESTMIPAGGAAIVQGKQYEAGERALRIVTEFTIKEVSLVAIGADERAKLREAIPQTRGLTTMNPQLRAYLESIGLKTEANEGDAEKFREGLEGEQKTRADALAAEQNKKISLPPSETPPAQTQRQDPQPPAGPAAGLTAEEAAQIGRRAVAEERERARQIRELAGDDVPATLRDQAILEGWDVNRCRQEFLQAVRAQRAVPGGGPGIHVRDSERDTNVRSLAAGLLMGQGLDPTRHRLHRGAGLPGRADRLTEQDADRGERFRAMSVADLVRECIRLDTGRWYTTTDEAMANHSLRSTPSGGSLSNVFSTNVYARLTAGWEEQPDSTLGWCDEEDVASFQLQEEVSIQANARLKRLPRGGTAEHATASDTHETYRIHRYAKQVVFDDQDIQDDRLNALMRIVQEMGQAARRLRPDGVYALMLSNPGLVADGVAVFNAATHGNLGSAALGASALELAITAIASQRVNNNVLNLRPRYLILPAALEWTGRALVSSTSLAKLFADTPESRYAVLNLLSEEGIRVVVDDRLGANGVIPPNSDTVVNGSDTAWYLTTGGIKGLKVAYLRGTGRQPQLRSFVLDRGQWGLGWDIKMDIGAAFMDYRTWYKSEPAS